MIKVKKPNKLIICIMILTTVALSGCIATIATGPQTYVKEQDHNNILTLYSDGRAISSEDGANFAGKYQVDDNKITVTWNFMGLVEFYTIDKVNQTLIGPEPKQYTWKRRTK